MEYKCEFKPFVKKEGMKYKTIRITDIALHTKKGIPTPLVGKKIQKSFEENRPGRIYSHLDNNATFNGGSFVLNLLKSDPDLVRMVQEEEAKGYKIRIAIPNEGIPVVFGKDTVEFINSKNGKRVLRGLAKEKEEK